MQKPRRGDTGGCADEVELDVQSLISATRSDLLQELEADEEGEGGNQGEGGGTPGWAGSSLEYEEYEEPEEEAPEEMSRIFKGTQPDRTDVGWV